MHLHPAAFDTVTVTDAAVATEVQRSRVDREDVSERDWLAHLDDRLYWLLDTLDAERRQDEEARAALRRQIAEQGDTLRGEIEETTRQGWQLIVAGLVLQALGAVLALFA